ncbi:MAG: hypothetical protein LBB34_02495 [Holosporales bacterium]|jgi:hypothetical protein|nr:hypothetical protein [Holosporales bacterium]
MSKTNIVLSDITCMKDKFCIAGWDLDECRMKRLLINGGYWDTHNLDSIGKWYSLISVNTDLLDKPRDYPQRTDDVNVNIDSIDCRKSFSSGQEVVAKLSSSVSENIMTIFNNSVVENSYVPQHTVCSSLGAVEILANHVTFVIKNGKLRAKISDNDKREYLLPVSCKYIRDAFYRNENHDKNVNKLNSILTIEWIAHLRIGLARPFSMQENHCYIMLNGLFLHQ